MTSMLPRVTAGSLAIATLALSGCNNHYDDGYYYYPPYPILQALPYETTLGSTVDPANGGDRNPHGLAIAPASIGPVKQGDLIICNYNDGATDTPGMGNSIVGLSPVRGSAPYTIAQDARLMGCSALAVLPDGNIVAAANGANRVVLVTPQGSPGSAAPGLIAEPFAADSFSGPWGLTYAVSTAGPALYVSNSGTGAVDRIALSSTDTQTGFTEIATGFSVNGSAPGAILAPAGLTYDAVIDALYVVDSNANRVVSLAKVSTIGAGGIVVGSTGFTGASAAQAGIVAQGSPFNGPVSAALLYSGNLIVGNTLDPHGTNLMIELDYSYGFFGSRNVDFNEGGALFGIATSGTDSGNQAIFFNDGNDDTVKVLSY